MPSFGYSAMDLGVGKANNVELGRTISDQRMFEWGFGRNMQGELSLGVTKNALVPACAVGLQELSTR